MDLSLPRGIRDIPPEDQENHERVRQAFYEVARLFNFRLMEPAPLEHLSVLRAKSGSDIDEQIYAFKDKAGRDIGLRFDLTVGMTRYVAGRRDLKPPVKLASFGGVWRYDEPQHARYRWFHQWDVEVYGAITAEADAEVIDLSVRLFNILGLKKTSLKIGDRRVVEEFIRKRLGVESEEKVVDLMRALDKVEKKTEKELLQEYSGKGFPEEQVKDLLAFGRLKGTPSAVLGRLAEHKLQSGSDLELLADSLKSRGLKGFEFNLSVVRGIDYYTGIVFEVGDGERPDLGSLCGGGRYDLLPKVFGRPELAATGAAGGVDRTVLSLSGMSKAPRGLAYVAYASGEVMGDARRVIKELRDAGISTESSLTERSLSKQLQDASSAGARWAIIVGAKELEAGKYTLKDMEKRSEKLSGLQEIVSELRGVPA
jgi:histidyl-tRNA synthetase